MPQNVSASVENNFTAGLKTEFTGLNFPENAATDADNVVFDIVGDVYRRQGIDFEQSGASVAVVKADKAMQTYMWKNAGGDGDTQLVVHQVGTFLYFYRATAATLADKLTDQYLTSVDISTFLVAGSSLTVADTECQFADGNGYLFVYHPHCEPVFCTYDPIALSVTAQIITINVRDFDGVSEGLGSDQIRPPNLTDIHKYNLINQGWTAGGTWTATMSPVTIAIGTGTKVFTVQSGLTISNGTRVNVSRTTIYSPGGAGTYIVMQGVVSSYSGTTLTLAISAAYSLPPGGNFPQYDTIVPLNVGYIDEWNTDTGFYPSNADVWWNFKNASDVFDPATQIGNVTLSSPAPKGSFILNAFDQQRDQVSNVPNIPDITTKVRPRTGAWFQGRVWYTGVDAFQSASVGVSPFYTWTENIYFSQIVQTQDQFGKCYQQNDPTSETLNALLPTDGGIIKVAGCGAIYKLHPIQNGMLVFASNGIFFITGSQGIGFTANDYTVTEIGKGIRSLSSDSFVNVNGLPVFWNEEGIYTISPAQQGLGLTVESLTVSSIDSLYASIPVESKKYARGDYHPIDYVIQWLYRSTASTDVTERYEFDKILCFNTHTKAFYTYTITTSDTRIHLHGINFIPDYGADSPPAKFKYISSLEAFSSNFLIFADEHDEGYGDWAIFNGDPINYESYFVTGYKIRGQAQRRWQPGYVYMYSRNDEPTAYKIQGIFDFATSGDSGRFSPMQVITINKPYYGMVFKRHRLRGQGLVGQIKVTSVDGEPFDIMGWSIWENSNTGV